MVAMPFFSKKGMLKGLIYEFEHVFVNSDPFFFVLTYVAIFIGAIVGPGMAMALYGGSLEDGEKAKPWMQPINQPLFSSQRKAWIRQQCMGQVRVFPMR